jgi:hypothetical protein
MKPRKKKKEQRKYAKPVSLHPLKPEEALAAFMKINPKKIKTRKQKSSK